MRKLEKLAWPAILAASTVIGSLAIACMMPFVALAVVVAASLPPRRAFATVTAIVAANQAIGFVFLGFPADSYTVAWGAALWVATLAAVGVARTIVGPTGEIVATRLALAAAAAFAAYELLLFCFATLVGGVDTFTPAIVARIAQNDALWLVALMAVRLLVTGVAPQTFGAWPNLRLAR